MESLPLIIIILSADSTKSSVCEVVDCWYIITTDEATVIFKAPKIKTTFSCQWQQWIFCFQYISACKKSRWKVPVPIFKTFLWIQTDGDFRLDTFYLHLKALFTFYSNKIACGITHSVIWWIAGSHVTMGSAVERTDEHVREYLIYRGFTNTLRHLDSEIKADKEKGFRVCLYISLSVRFLLFHFFYIIFLFILLCLPSPSAASPSFYLLLLL